MGEAKRRKAKAQRTEAYRNAVTGESINARMAGDPEAFWSKTVMRTVDYLEGNGDGASDISCNGCTECCYHAGVDISPLRDAAVLQYLDIEHRADGLFLRKGPDGACVHLQDGRCSVYDHRPYACRAYDCRVYSLTGVQDRYDGEHRQPPWLFEPQDARSRAFLAVCQMLGMLEFRRLVQTGEGSAQQVAHAVFADELRFRKLLAVLTKIALAPKEQMLAELKRVGWAPGEVTVGQYVELMRSIAGEHGTIMVKDGVEIGGEVLR